MLCDNLHPNNSTKKVAIKFSDDEGIGYDVFDYKKEVEYINIPGQYPHSIGPALIKNIETIYLDIIEMIKASEVIHNKEMKF